jgi:hypothetical protein
VALRCVQYTKYIGLMIDERMDWRKHVSIHRDENQAVSSDVQTHYLVDLILNQTFSILLIYPLSFDILDSTLGLHQKHEIRRTDPFSK